MFVKHGQYQGKDISDKKIYWDTEKQQFRRRIPCVRCATPVTCMCYETIKQALIASEYGILCNYCFVAEQLANEDIKSATINIPEELEIQELVDSLYDPAVPENVILITKISSLLRSKFSEEVMEQISDSIDDKWDYILNGAECRV